MTFKSCLHLYMFVLSNSLNWTDGIKACLLEDYSLSLPPSLVRGLEGQPEMGHPSSCYHNNNVTYDLSVGNHIHSVVLFKSCV